MKKRLLLCFLALCLVLTAVPAAYATENETTASTEAVDPYSCGEDLTWSFSGGTLSITGTGAMYDYDEDAPWAEYKEKITKVTFSGGVTYVGANAFNDYDALTAIDFGNSMREIGTKAFYSCNGLTTISLPSTFRRFGPSCFEASSNLTEVYCAGSMPSFNGNCLWNGSYITVYCPAGSYWPEDYVLELEKNFGGRLQVLVADGSDPYKTEDEAQAVTTAPTTAPTEAPTEETTEETTAETTEETTEATTEATTEETTMETTVETTEEVTEEVTEAAEEAPEEEPLGVSVSTIIIGVLGFTGVMSLLLALALILKNRRGGKFED